MLSLMDSSGLPRACLQKKHLTVVVPVASGRNLRTVFAASVFDGELKLRRLAALCGGRELGAVAA